ncbi:MAG: zinc-binding dehydrogenase [Desulfacinum sp.]|jgi:L-iditol 2-dehydrogenase|nr:zinc-binding dehydrogenase [Desulfacinum sp.]
MRALQIVRPETVVEVDVPEPSLEREGGLLVQLQHAMVCGTDLPFYAGEQTELDYPLAPGMFIHECTGIVVESRSSRFVPGDRVVALPRDDRGLCRIFEAVEDEAVHIPEDLEDMELAVLAQPLSTVLFALDKLGDVQGLRVDIVGGGPIGLLVCWELRRRGAGFLRVMDPVGGRCLMAERMGADRAIRATAAQVLAMERSGLSAGPAADICVEAVGHRETALNDAVALAARGGAVLALGVPEPTAYAFDYATFFQKNLRLIASITPPWVPYLRRAVELVGRHARELEPLITHRFPVQRAQEAYGLARERSGGVCKVALDARTWE